VSVEMSGELKMSQKISGQALLENAYKLNTPDDNVAYYRSFAPTYDSDFAQQLGWNYPKAIAEAYRAQAKEGDVPIADIGCGTGYVASELGVPRAFIDGLDISPDMLDIARRKNLYRYLTEVDLTGSLSNVSRNYGAVLSAGTFTHGHLGPGPLRNLLDVARAGGLFIIGVNEVHYEKQRFSETFDALVGEKRISTVKIDHVNIYSKADHDHSNDRALILHYRKM
jgi:predicted TPR repeat methyltransferase